MTGSGGGQQGQIRDNFASAGLNCGLSQSHTRASFFLLMFAMATLTAAKASSPNGIGDGENSQSETAAQIKALWNIHSEMLADTTHTETGTIYARYSSRYQDSIIDQVRTCLEFASQHGIFVSLEHIYYDQSKTGRHEKRPGFQHMRDCLLKKQADTLLVFATNRLFRKSNKCLDFVEQAVKEKKRRVVFIRNGIDSEKDTTWRRFLLFLSVFDEFASEMYVEHIRAAHVGKFERRQVTGTLAFGYCGKPVSEIANSKGKFDHEIVIHEQEAHWVKEIFAWFVDSKLSINTIIRKLNETPNVPKSRKGIGQWTRQAVITLLKNKRYLGQWDYGATEAVLLSSKDYVRQIERDTPLRSQDFEELQIISNEQFEKAQSRLLELKQRYRKSKNRCGTIDRPAQILNGLFFCPQHDRSLIIGGSKSQYLMCPDCQRVSREHRPLCSYLRRDLALQVLCETLAKLIRQDDQLIPRIVSSCQQAVKQFQSLDDTDLVKLQQRKQRLKNSLNLLLRQEPESDDQVHDLESHIRERRAELTQIERQLAACKNQTSAALSIPTETEIQNYLTQLEVTLLNVAHSGPPAEVDALREILFQLTGGRIELYQKGERIKKTGWLEGRFSVSILSQISREFSEFSNKNEEKSEIKLEFRKPTLHDPRVQQVWSMHQQGMLGKQIAEELNCCRATVSKLVKTAADNAGEPLADGRTRRASLKQKICRVPTYQKIADEVVRDFKQGVPLARMAEKYGCSSPTVKKAINFWYQSRDLPVPMTGDNREQMKQNAFEWDQAGMPLKTIAENCGVSDVQVRTWLNEVYAESGLEAPDRRKRRHLKNSESPPV
ncbi:recombinase family protein [Rubinisphaera italica]|uniref:Recombinase domain-containing protein n=1 Tax=Rubinisphaera italica TaxID=2527969 RepID=A0A5C5X9C0_9PLAN|nr:recombinase family protein [Rubinisphaera italica]TWT59309.1 hypothetical protein Pan54_00090 [Rubinisphaera italica]